METHGPHSKLFFLFVFHFSVVNIVPWRR